MYYVHYRYTASKDNQTVYAFLLSWPKNTTEVILGATVSSPSTTITLIGSNIRSLNWHAAGEKGGILIDLSNVKIYSLESDWIWVFRLRNITAKRPYNFEVTYRRW